MSLISTPDRKLQTLPGSWTAFDKFKALVPGVLLSGVVAIAAMFLSEHYGAPVMLFALLLGMALSFLSQETRCVAGLEFSARQVLRWGVALLGLRITAGQVMALGWPPVVMVVIAVVCTILVGIVLARGFGFDTFFGLLTGGAVAICGASAALAISAALPAQPGKERATLFTVIGVSALSTLAMVFYPILSNALGFDTRMAGFFIGGTIHDVAQVVGAGYSLSQETGDLATLIKLMRVAMLLPVIAVASWLGQREFSRAGAVAASSRPPLLPWFAIGFVVLVGINSTGWMPLALINAGKNTSQWCLVVAMAAIGMKTPLLDLIKLGWKPIALMLAETAFLASLFYGMLRWSAV